MSGLELKNVTKKFGTVNVIKGVDLKIDDGEFVVFVGPSGSGKSTLLRMIAGLEDTTSGQVEIGSKDVTHLDSAERGIAMVFQSYALYPHMKVRDNMGFGLKMNGFPKTEIESRINKAADILELSPLLDRKPGQLSGGQRQRVAIGRAIVREPQAFLFDEPLSNLDAELRVAMRVEIAKLHHELKTTMVYVTHDQTEAMTLADKIVVLRDGKIEQVGAPLKLYDDPDNLFIAGFIGSPSMNILDAKVVSSTNTHAEVTLPDFNNASISIPVTSKPVVGENYKLGIRPEHFTESGDCNITLKVDVAEHLGGTSYLYSSSNSEKSVVVENRTGRDIKIGSDVHVGIQATDAFLFDEHQQRIR